VLVALVADMVATGQPTALDQGPHVVPPGRSVAIAVTDVVLLSVAVMARDLHVAMMEDVVQKDRLLWGVLL
jgi:hypothetical protein